MLQTNSTYEGRREDRRFLTGQGHYTNDINFDDQGYAVFVRSDRAHASITTIDKVAAERAPGVLAVFVGSDLEGVPFGNITPLAPPPAPGGQKLRAPLRPMLGRDRVRFVGEEVALVVATTLSAARDAAELIQISYEEMPVLVGFEAALADGAIALHENIPGNVCFDFEYGDKHLAEVAFAKADGVVSLTVHSPRVAPTPMEPRGAVVAYHDKTSTFEIYCANQGGPSFRDDLAVLAGLPPERVRVKMLDVGGAFGARTSPFPEYPLLMHAAKTLNRPVKWLSTRSEDFLTDNHGRAVSIRGELAYRNDGTFLALRTDWLCDSGAYLTPTGVLTNSVNGMLIGAGAYVVGALHGRHRQVMTNTSPTNAYRGAGRPEAVYIVERLVDEVAARLKIDPFELRRHNLIQKHQMPYKTLTGAVFDSGDFPGLVAKAMETADWRGFRQRQLQSKRAGRLRGRGCATFLEPSGGGGVPKDQVAVEFQRDGTLALYNVAGPSGQGHETIFPQMMAEWLGISAEQIVLKPGDPDGPPLIGNPSIGSRSGMLQGSVFKAAAEVVIEKAKQLAAEALEAPATDLEFVNGTFTVVGTDRVISMNEIIERGASDGPHPLDTIAELPTSRSFPSGVHVVEVEVDPDTGAVQIMKYVAVDDIGYVINQKLADGQIFGGIVQGAGQVFGEHCQYDLNNGQLLTGSFMDYCMPRVDLIHEVTMANHSVPTPNNRLGAKGAGETGTTGALPACMNAVMDALRPLGVQHFDMPATAPRIWSAMMAARAARLAMI